MRQPVHLHAATTPLPVRPERWPATARLPQALPRLLPHPSQPCRVRVLSTRSCHRHCGLLFCNDCADHFMYLTQNKVRFKFRICADCKDDEATADNIRDNGANALDSVTQVAQTMGREAKKQREAGNEVNLPNTSKLMVALGMEEGEELTFAHGEAVAGVETSSALVAQMDDPWEDAWWQVRHVSPSCCRISRAAWRYPAWPSPSELQSYPRLRLYQERRFSFLPPKTFCTDHHLSRLHVRMYACTQDDGTEKDVFTVDTSGHSGMDAGGGEKENPTPATRAAAATMSCSLLCRAVCAMLRCADPWCEGAVPCCVRAGVDSGGDPWWEDTFFDGSFSEASRGDDYRYGTTGSVSSEHLMGSMGQQVRLLLLCCPGWVCAARVVAAWLLTRC